MRYRNYHGMTRHEIARADRLLRWPTREHRSRMLAQLRSEQGRTGTDHLASVSCEQEYAESWCRLDPSYRHPRRIRK